MVRSIRSVAAIYAVTAYQLTAKLLLIGSALFFLTTSTAVANESKDTEVVYKVTVTITGIRKLGGQLMVALEKSEEAFDEGPINQAEFMGQVIKVKEKTLSVTFTVPPGMYAIKTFHDENGNYELDSNLFGVPREPVGFSNDATGTFGPASFQDAKFEVGPADRSLSISLR